MTQRFPERVRRAVGPAPLVPDGTGRSGSRVFRAGDLFLKIAPAGELERAARMQEYFAGKGLSPPLAAYETAAGEDFLLVGAARGVSCIDKGLLAGPERLAAALGETARMLHGTDASDCPYDDVNGRAAAAYAKEHGAPFAGGVSLLRKDALVHGDFCLPNVFFREGRFSGFIDLGDAGLGDRHFDLYWALWSLEYNLGTDKWNGRFLDAYGRDAVDGERLAVCRALSG